MPVLVKVHKGQGQQTLEELLRARKQSHFAAAVMQLVLLYPWLPRPHKNKACSDTLET